jgi:teichuronic acid biosynthesis glycosyltransferase TuaG
MPASPLVSVIVPTWNRPVLLAEALASVRAQTFADWECVVADDGSTDETPSVAERFAREDPRFSLVQLSHSGSHGRARNAGIAGSRGPLIAFLDDDDLWREEKLARQVAALAEAPEAALVFCRVERFGEGTGLWPRRAREKRPSFERLLLGNFIPCSTVLARRAALGAAGLFPEGVVATPDYELWLLMARAAPILAMPDALCRYRVHEGNMSQQKALEFEELDALYTRLAREGGIPPRVLATARRGLARQRARAAPSFVEALPHWWRFLVSGERL